MEGKTPEELAQGINKSIEAMKTEIAKAVKPEQLEDVQNKLNTMTTTLTEAQTKAVDALKVELKTATDAAKEQGLEIAKLMEKGSHTGAVTFEQGMKEVFTAEKHEELKKFVESKAGGKFTIKAPGDTLTTNVTSDAVPANYAASMSTTFSPYTREEVFVEQFLDSGSTDKPSIAYVNEQAGEGDAAIVAEGSLKPLIDADFVTRYSEAKKVAGRMRVSEEAISDYPYLLSAMTGTLKRKHDLARQNSILNGAGGSDLNGIVGLATPFNAAMTATIAATTQAPTYYDVIAASAAVIQVESEGAFVPNVVFVNTLDALRMKLTKDDHNNYVLPPFISQDGTVVDGVQVVAKPTITAGEFIIGDMKNVKLMNYWGYRVEIGRDGNDFSENMYTLIGESRLHLYISDNDKRGILSGTFADVIAAI